MTLTENLGQTPDQKLVSEYLSKFDACKAQRQPFEKEWYTNLAFYFGRHYMQWVGTNSNTSSISMALPKAAAWRVRLVSNRIKTIVRKESAKVNKEQGIWYCIPSTPDDEDLAKARTADAVSDNLLTSKNYRLRKREANWWRGVCGTGFMKVYYTNDVTYLAPSPFHMWVPNIEEVDIQEQEFVVHGIATTVDEAYAQYNIKVEPDVNADNPESKFRMSLGIDKKGKELDHVFLKEFWVKSCPRFPNGAMFVIANKQLVYIEEALPEFQLDESGKPVVDESGKKVSVPKQGLPSNVLGGSATESSFPYKHGQYPFAKVDHIGTGRFYGESIIKDLIPLQKEYNRSRSQAIEARNLTSKPQWAVSRGAVDIRKLTAQPGLVIEYTPGFEKPEPVKNPELPSYFFQDQQANIADMDFIANQYEVTQGRTPPGVEAASAIAYLQEENDSILSDTIASLEEMTQSIGYQSVMLAQQFYDENKLIKIISGDQVYEVQQFKYNMLPEQVDFRVEPGSMAPRSRAAKQAFIIEMMDKGYLPPMEGLKYLDMAETARFYAELAVDTRQADRENFKMKNAQPAIQAPPLSPMGIPTGETPAPQPIQSPVQVNSFDNHQAHIYCHTKFMKSQTFEQLDPQVQQIFLQHYQTHLEMYGKQIVDGTGEQQQSQPGRNSAKSGSSSNGQQQPAGATAY